jgi:hypothetical protein
MDKNESKKRIEAIEAIFSEYQIKMNKLKAEQEKAYADLFKHLERIKLEETRKSLNNVQ